MENFLPAIGKALLIFLIGFILGIIKAYLRKSPISKKEEFIRYHQYLKKPVLWSFVAMFSLALIFGFLMETDIVTSLQKATVAGLFTAGGIYVFMIWGANLIRQ